MTFSKRVKKVTNLTAKAIIAPFFLSFAAVAMTYCVGRAMWIEQKNKR